MLADSHAPIRGGAVTACAALCTGEAAISRLAVLPCDNLSPDPNDSYFAPGIHEELLNRLAQIGNLRLTSRSSVLQYTDTTTRPTIPEIAAVLGFEGSPELIHRNDMALNRK